MLALCVSVARHKIRLSRPMRAETEVLGIRSRTPKDAESRATPAVLNTFMNRHPWRWGALLLVLLLVASLVRDVRTKMWIDELYTLSMARQASAVEIVKATLEGADGAPPLYAIVVHVLLPVVRPDALAVRLPATLGFCGMFWCLFAFCLRRMPAPLAMATAFLPCVVCEYYSSEGRAYGIVLGCAAGALLSWQAAIDGRRRTLCLATLAGCLALMCAMHYYAAFFLIPLLVAELVRCRSMRKPDYGMAAAMAPVALVLGVHYPLIAALRQFQVHHWSPAAWTQIPRFYTVYLLPMLLLLLLSVGSIVILRPSSAWGNMPRPNFATHERAAIYTLSLMPVGVVALSVCTARPFLDRYILWAVIGLAMLAGSATCGAARGKAAAGAVMLCGTVGAFIGTEAIRLSSAPALLEGQAVMDALDRLPDSGEPIVVADHHVFMELSYYSQPRIRTRLIYPVNAKLDLQYLNFDTGALLMAALRRRTKLHIENYNVVLDGNPRFLLAATPHDYLPRHFRSLGYQVVPIDPGAQQLVFEVSQ